MRCIRIGYGKVARLHENKLKDLAVKTVGILEKNVEKSQLAKSHGFCVLSDYEDAARYSPHFWDVCTCTASHVDVIEHIVNVSPYANILVEKPICLFSQIERLKSILSCFHGKLAINENYLVSQVSKTVHDKILQLGMIPTRVISEMTKNRSYDIANGRFLDKENFVFGYEGSHMLTSVLSLGMEYAPAVPLGATYRDMYIDYKTHKEQLHKQGSVKICYRSKSGVEVTLYTSMDGKIGFTFPHGPYSDYYIPDNDRRTRYRALAVEDNVRQSSVVGYYEPIANLPRVTGMVMVLQKEKLKESIFPIEDDMFRSSMEKTIGYFSGKSENICALPKAIDTVKMFQLLRAC